jgi:flagellar export protein FliJ
MRRAINAMEREPVRRPLDTGVRAINALMTVGRGQRLGLFAGSGVGKSVLLGMMARYTEADVTVVGLIGERGREVKEFIEDILGPEGLARAVVVAAPADSSPVLRMQGAVYATSIAEQFRDRGLNVLLLMDSLTRYAMAAREVALAIGEPPATKGYPPSVFARLPALVERAGNGRAGHGSITGFYTVLTEGDDQQDPIADAARAILDGHFVLDRSLAESGHYPAIDIEQSISRVMHQVVDARQLRLARRLKALWSRYRRSRDLISVGAYVQGSDPETDLAIALMPRIAALLQQDMHAGADPRVARGACLMEPALLKLLIEMALERRDDAATRAAGARRERDAAAATLRTLTDYREESLSRAPVRGGGAVGVAQLATATHFDAKLVAAIHQQYGQHAQRAADAEARDASLRDRQRRLKALQTLEERRAQQSARTAARREQRALDEFATQLSARKRPGKER